MTTLTMTVCLLHNLERKQLAIFHQIIWDYDADPEVLDNCTSTITQLLQPYLDNGSTIDTDNYWEPPRPPASPLPTSGQYKRLRLWGDEVNCTDFVNQVNSWRSNNTSAATVISEATVVII